MCPSVGHVQKFGQHKLTILSCWTGRDYRTTIPVDERIAEWHNHAMPKRSSINAQSISEQVAQEAEAQPEKNPAAVALGRMGGLKGGRARAAKLTPAKRKAIAKKAASARWSAPKK